MSKPDRRTVNLIIAGECTSMTDILPSWFDTPTRQKILAFIHAVSDPRNPDFVPAAERIAIFDNDGTLWCERPIYTQFVYAFDMLAKKAAQEPELQDQQPYKAALAGDTEWLKAYLSNDTLPQFINMVLSAVAGTTETEFESGAVAWLEQSRHPRFGLPYTQLVYQPMLELLDYLHQHDFQLFICSGGGMDFVRLFSEEIYNIPRQHVIGSNVVLTWEERPDGPLLVRQAGIVEPFNDGPGKPINIQLHIGRPPILAGGNSNGDLQMMEFAQAGGRPFLNLLLRHDDAQREYAYDYSAEKIQKIAKDRGWTEISMKSDFKSIFANFKENN
jgi:phosphoglycolate phosphatase-like HAD superfamily hydrolase